MTQAEGFSSVLIPPVCLSLQQQEQLVPAANKEFDPLGPLPAGWGESFYTAERGNHIFLS